jgi:glycosyltransferase involved in cell wall biosynthesis
MRIFHLAGFYPETGGPYAVVKGLTKALNNKGHQCGVCSFLPAGYNKHNLERLDFLEEVVYLENKKGFLSYFWPSFSDKWNKILEIIPKYDLVHIHGLFDYYAFFVSKNSKKPYIISPHGSLLPEAISKKSTIAKNIYLSIIGKKILANAAFIQVLNQYEQKIVEKLGVKSNNICVVPNGVDPETMLGPLSGKLLVQKFPYLKGKKIALFLGRLSWEKGLDDLIPAFLEVVREIKNAHLLLVGPAGDGRYKKKIFNLIHKLKLSNNISYVDPVYGNERVLFYKGSSVFVLPSYVEMFPMAAIEAMYMGLPVIVSNHVGISDIIEKNKCGLVVAKNKKDISKAIVRLLNSPEISEYMGARGKKLIEEEFLWDCIAARVMRIYEKTLSRKIA